jgi:gamma-glutamylcyclotransferase (GGCT)/AIG2-like uncharacterized protein YtfP
MATDLLFTYGTLMRGFPLHHLLMGRAEYLGVGTVTARLLDLGAYPGAARDPHGSVTGEVYRIRAPGSLTALDSAEGPQYHREETRVRMADGRDLTAFVYWYTGPLDRGVPIPGGDYRAHAPARSIHRTTSRGGHDAA